MLRRSAIEIGQFDHILPYIDKGIGVSQVDGLLFAPLAVRSFDEPYTVYGLIARRMERGPDDAWLRFDIDPRATFADGKPVRAEDVRFTYDLLMSKGSLTYRTQFADVSAVTVEGPRSIRFDFKPGHGRTLALDLASLPVLPEHDWQQRDFANGAGFDKPVGSGPYRIGQIDNGRSITFERDLPGGPVTCRPAVAATISPNCASSTSATPRWRARCLRAGATITTASSPQPPTPWVTTAPHWTTVACNGPT